MQWIPGRIKSKRVWSEGLFTLTIHCPGVAPFEPGQFLQLGMEQPEKHLHRPYSVASPHGEELDFFIVTVENGALTPKLWAMKEGDAIDVSQKAAGSFTLSHAPHMPTLWLVGTGTGLAPYIAMLRTPEVWDKYQKVVLVHGVRYLRDLAYQDELATWSKRYGERFCFCPVISREEQPGSLLGRITKVLDNGSLELCAKETISSERSAFMLCGNPDMLDEMEAKLEARGLKRHKAKDPGNIVVERYW